MFVAIDPGRHKCGWALVEENGEVAARGIWPREAAVHNLLELAASHPVDLIVLGDRTGHRGLVQELSSNPDWACRIRLVREDRSSEEARRRCVVETTRGWRRILPSSLRYPDVPYDDYVAVILSERYLRERQNASPASPDDR